MKLPVKYLKAVRPIGLAVLMASAFAPTGQGADAPNAMTNPGQPMDAATLARWSAPFRHWHYWPTHVIPASPVIPGATNIIGTDIPTVYQIPGDDKWYMSFVAFDEIGRAS